MSSSAPGNGFGSSVPDGRRRHDFCDPDDLDHVVFPLQARLAGMSPDGKKFVGFEQDVELFRRLEGPLVEWRDELERAAADPSTPRDEHGMSEAMRAALTRFQEEGGHASRLSKERIREIMHAGTVVFLELQVRERLRLTLGSVSALSRVPWSALGHGPHPMWPQYDWRTVMPTGAPDDQVEEDARKHLLIVRSSVLPSISERYLGDQLQGEALPTHLADRDLRRLGLAARGKYETFRIAQEMAKHAGSGDERDSVTFNIGTLGIPGERSLNRSNKPSEAHNQWMNEAGWRPHVDTVVEGNAVHKAIVMYWKRYMGSLSGGIEEFTRPKGLLEGKGYPVDEIGASAAMNALRMKKLVELGKHAAW